MTKLAAIFLILPLLGAALIDIYSPEDTGSIDWSGGSVRESQRYIQANLDSWRRDNLSAGLGGISVAIGVVVFAFAVKRDGDDRKAVFGAVGSAVLVLIGAATWMYICVNRFTLPPSVVAQNLSIASWTTPAMDIPFVSAPSSWALSSGNDPRNGLVELLSPSKSRSSPLAQSPLERYIPGFTVLSS